MLHIKSLVHLILCCNIERSYIKGWVYSGYLNTDLLNTGNISILNFLKFGFQNGSLFKWSVWGYVLCTRPTSANNLAWYFRRPKILDEVSFWGFSRSVKIEIFITLYGHPSVMQPIFDHSYTRRDWYSDPHCILFHFQIRKSSCRQMSNSVIGMNRCEACAKEVPKLSVSDFNNFQIRKRLDPPPQH